MRISNVVIQDLTPVEPVSPFFPVSSLGGRVSMSLRSNLWVTAGGSECSENRVPMSWLSARARWA